MVNLSSIVIAKLVFKKAVGRFKAKKACVKIPRTTSHAYSHPILVVEDEEECSKARAKAIIAEAKKCFAAHFARLEQEEFEEEEYKKLAMVPEQLQEYLEKKAKDDANYLRWWLSLDAKEREFRERRKKRFDREIRYTYESRFEQCEYMMPDLEEEFVKLDKDSETCSYAKCKTLPEYVCMYVLCHANWDSWEDGI
jgi:hypothetical protein